MKDRKRDRRIDPRAQDPMQAIEDPEEDYIPSADEIDEMLESIKDQVLEGNKVVRKIGVNADGKSIWRIEWAQ